MNADDFIPLLGKTAASPAIAEVLAKAGAAAPAMNGDDIDVRVSLQAIGVALVFQPDETAPDAPLQLIDVQLFRGGRDGFRPFQGALPHGLAFGDSRAAARKKLGQPDGVDDELDNDAWDYDGYSLILEYADARAAIGTVHLQMPYGEDEDDVDDADGVESSQRLV
jgi:hypothetical protein